MDNKHGGSRKAQAEANGSKVGPRFRHTNTPGITRMLKVRTTALEQVNLLAGLPKDSRERTELLLKLAETVNGLTPDQLEQFVAHMTAFRVV